MSFQIFFQQNVVIIKMNKLILVTKKFPYGGDTGEIYLRNELSILSQRYDEVIIISCASSEEEEMVVDKLPSNIVIYSLKVSNNKVHYFPKFFESLKLVKYSKYKEDWKEADSILKKLFMMYFLSKSLEAIKKIKNTDFFENVNREDKIIIYSYRLFDLAYISILIKNLIKDKCIVSSVISRAHGYDIYEEANELHYLPLRNYILFNLDYVYCCSINGMQYLKSKRHNFSDKIRFSYLGTKEYLECEQERNDSFRIVSCSNVNSIKRIDLIAKVISVVSKKINVQWIHMGGTDNDLAKLKKNYSDLIDRGTIIFKGQVSHEMVIDYYSKEYVDLFINLSSSEGIPQSIMEAISFEIPVIATDVGGTSEIVIDNINGYLVRKDEDPDSIANYIIGYYYLNESQKNEMRNRAKIIWEDKFNLEKNVNSFLNDIEV